MHQKEEGEEQRLLAASLPSFPGGKTDLEKKFSSLPFFWPQALETLYHHELMPKIMRKREEEEDG